MADTLADNLWFSIEIERDGSHREIFASSGKKSSSAATGILATIASSSTTTVSVLCDHDGVAPMREADDAMLNSRSTSLPK